jgi:phosphoglycolate phosphatase-like HAD superfamily hydrolase
VKPSEEEIRSVRGRSKREAIADLLTRHLGSADGRRLATEVYSRFQRILMERYEKQGVEPVDGAAATFEWLKARDVKVALSTGFDRALTALLLKMVGWGIGVLSGAHSETQLKSCPHSEIITSVKKLPSVLNS